MFKKYSAILALTATSGLLQVGHGALSSLMIQQGGRLEFNETVLGFLVTATYIGFLLSNIILYRLLPRVSYIRTFSVCAAVMTSLGLLAPLFNNELGWLFLRLMHGAFFCAAMIVCDGWLNTNAANEDRNKLIGIFTAVNYLCYGAGQYILVVADEMPAHAFILCALFMAMCLVPMCLTRFAEPVVVPRAEYEPMSLKTAYKIAPVAFVGQLLFGVYTGASWLFIRYIDYLEVPAQDQSTLAALFFGCGFLLQVPVGWMADKMRDRRDMILWVSVASMACAIVLCFGHVIPYFVLTIFVVLLGATSSTLFSLNIAYGQDFVERSKSSDYSGILLRMYAVGGLIGPPIVSFLMSTIAPYVLFVFCALSFAAIIVVTATNRLMPRYRPAKSEQTSYLSPMSATQLAGGDATVYSEIEIGPDLPEADAPEESSSDLEVGPDLPGETASEEAYSDLDIGPDLPEEADSTTADIVVGPDIPAPTK
ncbi:MAG: MFS transporter [Gammaproteobacteria bacterium WSBS_2016_MAG_OTU1]